MNLGKGPTLIFAGIVGLSFTPIHSAHAHEATVTTRSSDGTERGGGDIEADDFKTILNELAGQVGNYPIYRSRFDVNEFKRRAKKVRILGVDRNLTLIVNGLEKEVAAINDSKALTIEFNRNLWKQLNLLQKRRLVFHEGLGLLPNLKQNPGRKVDWDHKISDTLFSAPLVPRADDLNLVEEVLAASERGLWTEYDLDVIKRAASPDFNPLEWRQLNLLSASPFDFKNSTMQRLRALKYQVEFLMQTRKLALRLAAHDFSQDNFWVSEYTLLQKILADSKRTREIITTLGVSKLDLILENEFNLRQIQIVWLSLSVNQMINLDPRVTQNLKTSESANCGDLTADEIESKTKEYIRSSLRGLRLSLSQAAVPASFDGIHVEHLIKAMQFIDDSLPNVP